MVSDEVMIYFTFGHSPYMLLRDAVQGYARLHMLRITALHSHCGTVHMCLAAGAVPRLGIAVPQESMVVQHSTVCSEHRDKL